MIVFNLELEKEELYVLYKELYDTQNKLSYMNLLTNKQEKHYKNIIDGVINKIACIMDESVVNNHLSESEKISRNPVGELYE